MAETAADQMSVRIRNLEARFDTLLKRTDRLPVRDGLAAGLGVASDIARTILAIPTLATLLGAANRWQYDFTQVRKVLTGLGTTVWATVSNGVTGSAASNTGAGNLYEVGNTTSTTTGALGIGIDVEDLTFGGPDCEFELLPIALDLWAFPLHQIVVTKADDTHAMEWFFNEPNPVRRKA